MADAREALVRIAAVTHRGAVRPNNEDCIAVGTWMRNEPMTLPQCFALPLDPPCVCLVLDGMGGHAAGEVAAQTAAQALAAALPSCGDEASVAAGIRAANAAVYAAMQADPRLAGMGTTLAGVRVARDGVLVFNVGDSRVYRVQDGFLAQLSTDDVPAAGGVRMGVVTQSLGGGLAFRDVVPHVLGQPDAAGRTYLVCSDGLYDALEPGAMERCLDDDLEASAARLLDAALAAGATDNVSVILVSVP